MDPRIIQESYRIEHRHGDGSWGEMVEDRPPHDAAELDPERGWRNGRLFRCTSCDESVMIVPDDPGAAGAER
jgi:hypothetical protein